MSHFLCTLRFPEIAFVETAQKEEEGFIDNTRNVGVVLGEKDIKQDVKGIKTRLMQFSGNSVWHGILKLIAADSQQMALTLRMTTRLWVRGGRRWWGLATSTPPSASSTRPWRCSPDSRQNWVSASYFDENLELLQMKSFKIVHWRKKLWPPVWRYFPTAWSPGLNAT